MCKTQHVCIRACVTLSVCARVCNAHRAHVCVTTHPRCVTPSMCVHVHVQHPPARVCTCVCNTPRLSRPRLPPCRQLHQGPQSCSLLLPCPRQLLTPWRSPADASVFPTIGTTSEPVTLVQDCLLSIRLVGVLAGGPWLPWPGAQPMSGVAVSGSLASLAGEPGRCLEWFRCQQPILPLGWPSVGPWLPWPGAQPILPLGRPSVGPWLPWPGSLAGVRSALDASSPSCLWGGRRWVPGFPGRGPAGRSPEGTRALQPCSRGGHV